MVSGLLPARVVVSPGAEALAGGLSAAEALAGGRGTIVMLRAAGVSTLRRRLAPAEVYALRKALLGLGPGEALRPRLAGETLVGFVCAGGVVGRGAVAGSAAAGATAAAEGATTGADHASAVAEGATTGADHASAVAERAVAVADHANLTWMSPLVGPNDDSLGPRFPAMAGIYEPGVVQAALGVPPAVVACVGDIHRLGAFEAELITGLGWTVVSHELAPVAITAAHLGFCVAAAVLVGGSDTHTPWGTRGEER
ncbi:MAG: hypothetical protein Kow00122_01130 [Thermoleophilia bacterium]